MDANVLSVDVGVDYADFHLRIKQDIEMNGIVGLLGASGSGKTTLLRTIAGFERTAAGHVRFGNEVWQDSNKQQFIVPYRRAVGFVFQDARLFSHLDVEANLRFADDRARQKRRLQFDDVVAAFDVAPLFSRSAATLSGGERQRVAITRSVLARPQLLLMDEPLAAMDTDRKREILPYIRLLTNEFDIPVVFVSHAVGDVTSVCNQVLVLSDGDVVAHGPTVDTLNAIEFDALEHRETLSIVEATVVMTNSDDALDTLAAGNQQLLAPTSSRRQPGDVVRLHINAGDVAIATRRPQNISIQNVLEGSVTAIHELPGQAFAIVTVDIGGPLIRAQLTHQSIARLQLTVGMTVFALLKTAAFERR